jgi:hypothetical protein
VGGAAPAKKSQLLDNNRQAGRVSPHHGGLGPLARWSFPVQGRQSRKARNLAENPRCVLCTEHAQEAVIVEGVAEIAAVPVRRVFLKKYKPKYNFDMAGMEQDILSMKEPVFSVRPQVVFGMYEKRFLSSATHWKFKV